MEEKINKSTPFKRKVKKKTVKRVKKKWSHDSHQTKKERLDREFGASRLAITKAKTGLDASIVETNKERVELLQLEWAAFHSDLTVFQFVTTEKGYSDNQYTAFIKLSPVSEWQAKRELFRNKITNQVVQRHIDKVTEMNDEHVKAGRLGIARGLSLLTHGVSGVIKKTGKPFKRPLYPQEFNFVMSGLKTAQEIYRRAMGLPSDGEGMRQVVDELAKRDRAAVQNIQINVSTDPKSTEKAHDDGISQLKALMDQLSHDEIKLFVEQKRKRHLKEIEPAIPHEE